MDQREGGRTARSATVRTRKHTDGPWNVCRQNPSPTTGEWMVSGATHGYLAEVRDCGSGDVAANARLIAAAPDLLDVAEMVLALATIDTSHELIKAATAAIAKARGAA